MKSVVFGSAMLDTIAVIPDENIERLKLSNAGSSFLLLQEGSKSEANQISAHCGGGAVNAAVAMSRLGFEVRALIKLGRDSRAETVMRRLKEESVSTNYVIQDQRLPTGAAVMISSHHGNAAIFTFRGANTLLEPSELDDEAFEVDLVYIAPLSGRSADCLHYIVQRAKAAGALIAINPGPRQLTARGPAFERALRDVDILSLNRSEAEILLPWLCAQFGEGGPASIRSDLPRLALEGMRSSGSQMSLRGFFDAMRQLGPKSILLTDGAGGAFLSTADKLLYCPIVETKVVATAGAGDAFSSTFASFITLGRTQGEALRAAAINSASVVGQVDTQSGLLKFGELTARLTGYQGILQELSFDVERT